MKNNIKVALAGMMAVSMVGCANNGSTYTPGTYTREAQGFGGIVSVTITVDESSITDVTVKGDKETKEVGGAHLDELAEQIKTAQSAEIDGVSGATVISTGVKEAAGKAIEAAQKGEATAETKHENVPVTYTPGTYTGTAEGYNGPIESIE